MPTACPWEYHVRRYTGGHPLGNGVVGVMRAFVCSTERKYPTDKPWAFISLLWVARLGGLIR